MKNKELNMEFVSMARDRILYWLAVIPILTILAFGQYEVQKWAHRQRPEQAQLRYWGEYANTKMIRRFLGLRVVAADLIWIDLLYKSDLRREGDWSPFYKAMKTIHKLDPQNFIALWFGGLYLSVVKDDIKGASILFRDAVVSLDQNPWVDPHLRGSIHFAYGYHLMFEEKDFDAASKYIKLSAENARASLLSKQMSETLSTEQGIIEVGFRVLNDFYRRAKNDEERKAIEQKMKKLFLRKEIHDLNLQFAEYLKRTDTKMIPKARALSLFLRSINHRGVDSVGRKIKLNEAGMITAEGDYEQ